MKGLNINISSSCTTENSTAILSSTMDLPSSSSPTSSSSTSSPFSSFTTGSRAIDRHNPIITDERRSGGSSCTSTPIRTPCTNNVLQHKPSTPNSSAFANCPKPHHQSTPKKKGSKLASLTKRATTTSIRGSKKNANAAAKPPFSQSNIISDIIIDGDDDDDTSTGRRSFSKPSDLMIMKAAAAAACSNSKLGVEYMSPPESSRYLLDDTSFLEVLSDFDPVLKLVPFGPKNVKDNTDKDVEDDNKKSEGSKPPKSSSSSGPSEQVVVLRVSLHCRGCERKMKKHLSRMAGVTSFNIDFAAKKVTVVGDVTPLGVLASISKVKTAKLWTPASISSSSQLNSRNMYAG